MKFNHHPKVEGRHAFLSPSTHNWVLYDDEKLEAVYLNWLATQKGTELHELASKMIDMRVGMERKKKTLNMYVNDGIGFMMHTEVCLYFSEHSFGTADAIAFDGKTLRIHDLKTGKTVAAMQQLRVYAALFCLEYGYSPKDFKIELRIYQNDEVRVEHPEVDDILYIMDKIKIFDKRIREINGD